MTRPRTSLPFLLAILSLSSYRGAAASSWPSDPNTNLPVCTAAKDQGFVRTTTDGSGGAILAWQDKRNQTTSQNSDVYAARILDNGQMAWTLDGIVVRKSNNDEVHVQILSDEMGGAIVLWVDWAISQVRAQRLDSSGNLLWPEGGVLIASTFTNICVASCDPRAVSDGAHGAIVCWEDTRAGNKDVYAQRIDADGNLRWAPGGMALCDESHDQRNPRLASDSQGGAIVTWTETRNSPSADDIYAHRVDADGNTLWAEDGIAVCTVTNSQYYPEISSDSGGGAVLAWQDNRTGTGDVYAQKLDGNGNRLWTTQGVRLRATDINTINDDPRLVSDGSGGAIVVFRGMNDLYAQRVDAAGSVRWTNLGVAVCTAPGVQWTHEPIPDGSGGVVVTWYDERAGDCCGDVYAQRFDDAGSAMWTANGAPISTAALSQGDPAIVASTMGSSIIVWSDSRGGNFTDIYAQQISADGVLGQTVSESESTGPRLSRLGVLWPNPFNREVHIGFAVPATLPVRLEIFDVAGRRVRRLFDGTIGAGEHSRVWDGRRDDGSVLPAGVYVARVEWDSFLASSKLVLQR